MPEDENRDGLRIGGWVPPYRDSGAELYRDSLTPQARRGKGRKVPAFLRNLTPRKQQSTDVPPSWTPGQSAEIPSSRRFRKQRAASSAPDDIPPSPKSPQQRPGGAPPSWMPPDAEPPFEGDPTRRSRLVLAAAAGVVVAVIVGFALAGVRQAPPPPSTDADSVVVPPPPPPLIPSAPVSILPKPTSPAPSRTSTSAKPSATKKSKAPAKTATPIPSGVLVPGSTIGLEIAGFDGFRVTHDDSDVGIDRVDADSSADEKADASFRVRKGLASSSCLSFESANSPGHFLRHRDFELHLDARDGSQLFDQDATFCPRNSRDDDGVELHSVNYPDHALAVRRGDIRLDDDRATTFEVRAPL